MSDLFYKNLGNELIAVVSVRALFQSRARSAESEEKAGLLRRAEVENTRDRESCRQAWNRNFKGTGWLYLGWLFFCTENGKENWAQNSAVNSKRKLSVHTTECVCWRCLSRFLRPDFPIGQKSPILKTSRALNMSHFFHGTSKKVHVFQSDNKKGEHVPLFRRTTKMGDNKKCEHVPLSNFSMGRSTKKSNLWLSSLFCVLQSV